MSAMGQQHPNNGYSPICDCQYSSHEQKQHQPTHSQNVGDGIFVRTSNIVCTINLKRIVLFSMSLPFYALFTCLAISMNMHYDQVMNNTWCPQLTGNRFASISIVVSVYYPERYIWMIAIVFHAAPRLFIGYAYKHYYTLYKSYKKRRPFYSPSVAMIAITNNIEIGCLVILSLIGIEDNFTIHGLSFLILLAAGVTGMVTNVVMHSISGIRALSPKGNRAFWIKLCLVSVIFILSFVVGFSYLFYAYYCHSWAYPTFTVCEYIVVIGIIAFHGLVIMDLPDRVFVISIGSALSKDYSIPAVL